LRSLRGLPHDLDPPPAPEAMIRDAKGWIGRDMAFGYDPVIHQLEFSCKLDLEEALANPSFNRFYICLQAAGTLVWHQRTDNRPRLSIRWAVLWWSVA
jgi:hypothetical protein